MFADSFSLFLMNSMIHALLPAVFHAMVNQQALKLLHPSRLRDLEDLHMPRCLKVRFLAWARTPFPNATMQPTVIRQYLPYARLELPGTSCVRAEVVLFPCYCVVSPSCHLFSPLLCHVLSTEPHASLCFCRTGWHIPIVRRTSTPLRVDLNLFPGHSGCVSAAILACSLHRSLTSVSHGPRRLCQTDPSPCAAPWLLHGLILISPHLPFRKPWFILLSHSGLQPVG